MILSTPCAKKRKCRICTNKRTAALTNKPRFAEPGFAVCLKQGHWLPAFVTGRKQEYVLSGFAVCLKQGHCLPAFVTRRKREYGLSGFAVWLKQRHCLPAFVTRRKQEYVLSGFAVCLKQGHCLPAFAVRLKREYGLARLVMTEPSSLAVQNLFRQFFRYLSCSPGQELFLRTAKNYKPVSHFCSNGRTFISTQRSRLFPKAEMSGLFPSDNWSAKRRPSPPAVLSVPDSPVFQKTDGR